MGLASSHALGLALGRPDKRVIVLDGDGSLLMNLGTLVTIAEAAPKNLIHFVCENGTYEANGGHPIPGRGKVRLRRHGALGRLQQRARVLRPEDFEQQAAHVLKQDGPVFATCTSSRRSRWSTTMRTLDDPARRKALKAELPGGDIAK